MAEKHQITERVTGKTIVLASVAGLIIGGPLIGLMGFTFMATLTLLLISCPLLLIFSPVLFGAAVVFALAMAGFAAALAMAVAGVSVTARVLHSATSRGGGLKDWGGYDMRQKSHNPLQDMLMNES